MAQAPTSGPDEALRIRQLENKLSQVTHERDALEKDLEQLCLARGGHMFSSSYVLSERLKFLEAEVKQLRKQLSQTTTERDSALEDIVQLRALKRGSDQAWQQEQQRVAALEHQVAFYQGSSAKAISERDSASYEAQHFKYQLETQAAALRESESQLSARDSQCEELQSQLAACKQQLEAARSELARIQVQLRQVHSLQQQLRQQQEEAADAKDHLTAATAHSSSLEAEVATLQQQLAAAQAAQQDLMEQQHATAVELKEQLQEAQSQARELQARLEQSTAAFLASEAAVKQQQCQSSRDNSSSSNSSSSGDSAGDIDEKSAASKLQEELAHVKHALEEAEESLQRAAHDKLELQLVLCQLQSEGDPSIVSQLQQRIQELQHLLALANQDKLAALAGGIAAAAAATSGSGVPAIGTTPPPSPATSGFHRPPAAASAGHTVPRPGSISSSSSGRGGGKQHGDCLLTPPTPGRELLATAETDAGIAAALHLPAVVSIQLQRSANTGTGQPPALLRAPHPPVSPPGSPASSAAAAIGASGSNLQQRGSGPGHDCSLLRQQLQQRLCSLEQLLLFASHFRTALQQLQPEAVASAAAAGSDKRRGWGSSRTGAAAVAAADPLQMLAQLAKELDASRQLLVHPNRDAAQQQQKLLLSALEKASSSPQPSASASTAGVSVGTQLLGAVLAELATSTTSSDSNVASSTKGVLGGLSKMLGSSSSGGGGGGGPQSTAAAGTGPVTAGAAPAASWGAELSAGLAFEVQLLADTCVAALQQVQKLTAINNLMDTMW